MFVGLHLGVGLRLRLGLGLGKGKRAEKCGIGIMGFEEKELRMKGVAWGQG